jgi:primosomal protein N' (replication factor Y)
MDRITLFVDVLLPLPVEGTFTYRVPETFNDAVSPWKRVAVQFGKKKVYSAIVVKVHQKPPDRFSVKYILSVIDEKPVMTEQQYTFWRWLAEYYMCHPGEVMQVALPSALKLASETKIVMNPAFSGDVDQLGEKEYLVTEALSIQKELTLTEVEKIIEQKKVIPLIKSLLEKEIVLVKEEIRERFAPKKETFVRLAEAWRSDQNLQELFSDLESRAFRQLEVLMAYVSLSGFGGDKEVPVARGDLLKKVKSGSAALTSLRKKGVLETFSETVSRLDAQESDRGPETIELTEDQDKALKDIRSQWEHAGVVLFHGVTSSGKTEIYIKLINEVLKKGKQVLYLLPEIALTTQIISRLRTFFGDRVGVYHSKYSENERLEIWNQVLGMSGKKDKYQVIIGPRSALFLPFRHLGLIIVDEEHDYSFKQFDPAPRYNARDAAVYLGTLNQCPVLLGSATPALETFFNSKTGKYGYVELNKRYGDIRMPEIFVADVRKEKRQKTMKSHFSSFLLEHIDAALENKEQVILFQNRRGYSLRLECDVCHGMPECKNCDVTLIYHKQFNQLRCHYCGFSRPVPGRCDSCGSTHLQMKGFGTEKLEDELALIYPEVRIQRMDLDTTRSRFAYQHIIQDFEHRRIDILVGTQMVTKGLDFDNVSVVGIMNADNMISFPDFRSYERSFQLMAQVSGRAGRKNKQGKVIIQTYNPHHSVIRDVVNHDYTSMYQSQILERRNFKYPPFYRMIHLLLKHKEARTLNEGARELSTLLRERLGNRILGPEYPLIARIRNQYIKRILIKLERDEHMGAHKKTTMDILEQFNRSSLYRNIRVAVDVDPV